jgi:hypothetical protein
MLWKRAAAGAPSAAGADEELQPEDGSNSWGSYITGILVVSLAAWTVLYALAIYMQEVKSFKRANVFKVVIFGYMWMVGSIVASLPCIPLLLMGQFSRCRDLGVSKCRCRGIIPLFCSDIPITLPEYFSAQNFRYAGQYHVLSRLPRT